MLAWYEGEKGVKDSAKVEELCNNAQLSAYIRMKMSHIAEENNLQPYEVPSALLLISDSFTEQNGLLTASFKVRRSQIYEKYQTEIKALANHQV